MSSASRAAGQGLDSDLFSLSTCIEQFFRSLDPVSLDDYPMPRGNVSPAVAPFCADGRAASTIGASDARSRRRTQFFWSGVSSPELLSIPSSIGFSVTFLQEETPIPYEGRGQSADA